MDQDKLRVYIVDDDPDTVGLLTSLLEDSGHAVISNHSSESAMSALRDEQPDCVVIDLMMPGIDGLELCKEVRGSEDLSQTKIIVISGKAYDFDRKRAFEFGADAYITKPINAKKFVPSLERVVGDRIEMRFWGVRGTLPVSGEESIRYGGETSCVSLEFAKGQFFIFDAGSGIKSLSNHLMAERRGKLEAKIFISHPHWDHINALPFFVPLYVQGNEFEVLGASHGDITVRELISAQMDGIYFPITIKEFGAHVYFRNLKEETINIDNIVVKTMLLNHPGYCLGYRVEYKGRSICYITDNELYLESSEFYNPYYVKRLTKFISDADVLITDTTYTDEEYEAKVGWGHSCISRVIHLAHDANVRQLYLFHHDPDQSDEAIDAKLQISEDMLKELDSKTEVVAPAAGTTFLL